MSAITQSYITPPPSISRASLDPPPPPSAPRTRRAPLEGARTVISPEIFQRRHLEEYAHLHDDVDSRLLHAEEKRLEEERRIGRFLRERNQAQGVVQLPGQAANGRRPLSLVAKRENVFGHARSKTEDHIGLGIGLETVNIDQRRASVQLKPLTLRSSLVSPPPDAMHRRRMSDQGLEVLVEKQGSLELGSGGTSSEGDTSLTTNQSTYSWATSFSGETTELRTAAHYVPPPGETDYRDDEIDVKNLDSPAKKQQRRKRIVAIAHTVRQLEGVGSRDLEDPTFYSVLEKAWFDRFEDKRPQVNKARPPLLAPPTLPPTPYSPSGPVPAFVPERSGESSSLRRYLPPGADGAREWASPPDPEFRTPHTGYMEDEPAFRGIAHHSYPRPESSSTSQQSKSVRYSYASTLHDLALEGQGSRLMAEKAWLRPSSYVGTPWGGDFGSPPPLHPPPPQMSHEMPSQRPLSDSPFELGPPTSKTLRRVDGNVTRMDPLPQEGEAGPSKWGLGFVNAWWDKTPPITRHPSMANIHQTTPKQDFQGGEDGRIPQRTCTQERPRPASPSMASTRTSSSSSGPVLEPAPTDISALTRRPPRRHSTGDLRPVPRHRRPLSRGRRRSDLGESACSTRYPSSWIWTPSIISSDLPPALSDLSPTMGTAVPEATPVEAGDGSIGWETSSRPSTSSLLQNAHLDSPLAPFPTPPLTYPSPAHRAPRAMPMPMPMPTTPPRYDLPRNATESSLVEVATPTFSYIEKVFSHPAQRPAIPTRSSSQRRASASSSSQIWSSGTAQQQIPPVPPLPANAEFLGVFQPYPVLPQPALLPRPLDPHLRRPGASRASATSGTRHEPAASATAAMVMVRDKPKTSAVPKTMFWLGFVMPLLWLVGAWPRSREGADLEKGGVAVQAKRLEEMSWWRRHTYHPDPYVERCRWAVGLTVPLCLLGGVAVAIVLSVMG